MAHTPVLVTKDSGIQVPFSTDKLRKSLARAGASGKTIANIITEINGQLYPGISTKIIYRTAFKMLKQMSKPVAARYKLKKAIAELGPTGYPFEKYMGEILKHQGYKVQVGILVQGKCIQHELDVVADKGDERLMLECKFHNRAKHTSDVKVALYVQARFLDVKSAWEQKQGNKKIHYRGGVVTNTRFTKDAIQYGTGMGMYMLAWNYPEHDSLRTQIDKAGLHPITCLNTLKRGEKQRLLEKKVVLCMEICNNENLLKNLGIKDIRRKHILDEAHGLCDTPISEMF